MTQPNPTLELAFVLTGPPETVAEPGDCPGFGRELPAGWNCIPDCPIGGECYAAWTAAPADPHEPQEDSNGHQR